MRCNRKIAKCFGLVLVLWGTVALPPIALALHPITRATDIFGAYPHYPKPNLGGGANTESIKKGEYLAKVGDCIACHTDTESGSAAFAGGLPIKTPFGTFFSPNITPDLETGIGGWCEQDFIRLMHRGIRPDGSNAFPALPYVYFNRVTIQDLKDIWAYLQALPAVNKENKGNTLPIVMDWRVLQYGWKAFYFYPDQGFFKNDPNHSVEWNRGAYLVNGLGHCTMCHTPMNFVGAEQKKFYLTGSFIQGYWAPDISQRGLQSASRFQVADVFLDGQLINQAGPVRGPMSDANHDSLKYLIDADRLAIATYLKSVVSRQPRDIPKITAGQSTLKRGQQVYANVCILCHLNGEVSAPRIGDQANWLMRIQQSGRSALYRHAVNGFNKMPPKGACVTCKDSDIKAAVDYLLFHSLLRTQWDEFKNPPQTQRITSTSIGYGERVYNENCSLCHDDGKFGAPQVGDQIRWAPLVRKNLDTLILHALDGYNHMPAKGGCTQCSGSDIIAAVKYMVQTSQSGGDYSLW